MLVLKPMDVLSGVSGALSISNSIIDLTSTKQTFPTLAEIVGAVVKEVERVVTDVVYQNQLHEVSGWISAYSEDLTEHIIDFESGFTPPQLFDRLVDGKRAYFLNATALSYDLVEMIRDEDSGVEIASKSLLMYLTLETFIIGLHKEIIRVAKLAVDHPTAAAEAVSQQAYAVREAEKVERTANELLRIIAIRRQAMVTSQTEDILSSGPLLTFGISDTYIQPSNVHDHLVLLFNGWKSDPGFIGRATYAYQNAMVGWSSADTAATPGECVSSVIATMTSPVPRSLDEDGSGSKSFEDPNLQAGWKIAERILESAQWYTDTRSVINDFRNMWHVPAVVDPPLPAPLPTPKRDFIAAIILPSLSPYDPDHPMLKAFADCTEGDCQGGIVEGREDASIADWVWAQFPSGRYPPPGEGPYEFRRMRDGGWYVVEVPLEELQRRGYGY